MRVTATDLPPAALLQRYATRPDCFTDCYMVEVRGPHDLGTFVRAFYTTPLFRLERLILRFAARRPSTDVQVDQLIAGQTTRFAAWDVEARADDQLLMCDMAGRTRSWFMVIPEAQGTRLYFGSAVVPPKPGKPLGRLFTALLGFHRLYSRALLADARRRLG